MGDATTEYVYGYGSAKHIKAVWKAGYDGDWGLCGAPGGHPLVRDHLPVCKRCERMAAVGVESTSPEENK